MPKIITMEPQLLEKVSITEHARQRLAERWDWHTIAFDAYTKGEVPSQKELDVIMRRGLLKANYWTRIYRKYKGMIFVFEPPQQRRTVLITVLPHH